MIYQDIERYGYRQSDMIEDSVEVAFAANGDLLLIDGRHRLILVQLLGLKKIPVVVNLVAASVARSLLDCSDYSTARPCEESKRTIAAQWISRYSLSLAVAKFLGLKNNACPLDRLLEVEATFSGADAESLMQQLLHQTVGQRFNALITIAGARNGEEVMVNAHQCIHYSS